MNGVKFIILFAKCDWHVFMDIIFWKRSFEIDKFSFKNKLRILTKIKIKILKFNLIMYNNKNHYQVMFDS